MRAWLFVVCVLTASVADAQTIRWDDQSVRWDPSDTFGWVYSFVSFGAPVGEGVTQTDAFRIAGRVARSLGVNHGFAVRLILECPSQLPCALEEQRGIIELIDTHSEVQGRTMYPPTVTGTGAYLRGSTLKLAGRPCCGVEGDWSFWNVGNTRFDDNLIMRLGARILAATTAQGCGSPGYSFDDNGGNGFAHFSTTAFGACAGGLEVARVATTGLLVKPGLILQAPDASCWRTTVDNSGALQTASVSCP